MINSRYLTLYKIEKNLGFLEEKILFLINKNGNKPREILKFILKNSDKKYAYTTIMTVMDRLYKKGFLKREKKGKTYYYFPVFSSRDLNKISHFYLIKSLTFLLSPLTIFNCLFYFFIIYPLVIFLSQPFFQGMIKIILTLSFVLFFLNSLLIFYLNGFLDFVFLIMKEPKIFLNYLLPHVFFLSESFSFLAVILVVFFGFYFLRKIFKNSYYLKLNY